MIEKIVIDYLEMVLEVPVFMERPEKAPKKYVIVEKTGSSRENFIKSATLALKSHADSLLHAAELNEKVKEAMDSIVTLDAVSRSELNSDYNFTDPTSKTYRYQAVYDLVHY